MAFNGSGTFVRVYNWVTDAANAVNITASRMDGEDDGFASGLSNCLTRDGQSPALANIPLGGFKITGMANGAAATDAVAFGQISSFAPLASPTFTGVPAAPTAAVDTNTTQLATTAFVIGPAYAKLASPALTGTPTAPTAAYGTATTQLATTAFADALRDIPANSQVAAYTLALTDRGKYISITTGGVIVPANASVAFAIGATVSIYNDSAASQTIAITTDTMYLGGTATVGSRTLAQRGLATLLKVAATTWVISGAGVT